MGHMEERRQQTTAEVVMNIGELWRSSLSMSRDGLIDLVRSLASDEKILVFIDYFRSYTT